jgi:hypothetical protein
MVPLPTPLDRPLEGPSEPLAPAPPALGVPDDGEEPLPDGAPDGVPAVPDGARDPLPGGAPLPPAPAGPPVDEHPVVVERTATPLAATKATEIDTRRNRFPTRLFIGTLGGLRIEAASSALDEPSKGTPSAALRGQG